MPSITYIEHSGEQHQVDVEVGMTVMEGAIHNGIPGIDAECGGELSCATCHVYVEPGWEAVVTPQGRVEAEMLELTSDPRENSRLSCRLVVDERYDGLVVRTPENQF